jgi:hypothetical protein
VRRSVRRIGGNGVLPDTDRGCAQLRQGCHEASDLDRLGHVDMESRIC